MPDLQQQKLIWNDAAKIEAKVKALVADELSVDISRVTPEADWYKDFGCSLNVVEVFMRCEEEFGIEIPNEDTDECETVGQLTAYIQRQFGVTAN
ncbi:MAG: acyl carrier protein [Abitibacteriaceae bacterium]|nr:acyl carrier protein [Abditibacteriaceae bacterium]MBV9863976.1 acyl carrier protein [Abditibacteriaceae bacterium]